MKTLTLSVFFALALAAQPVANREGWTKPFPGHRVAGNVYYVGTEDLACYLITDPAGQILINTGLVDSTPILRKNIEDLGFRFADIKILLAQQAHFDHTAALAEIKRLTGAKMFGTERDVPALEKDGGARSPAVKVDRALKDGEIIRLGKTELKVILAPGHTKGSVSYETTVREGGKSYRVLIANLPTLGGHSTLLHDAGYPDVVKDFEYTIAMQKTQSYDIFLAAHGSQYNLLAKYKPGQAYSPETFVDRDGLKKAVALYETEFRALLAKERGK